MKLFGITLLAMVLWAGVTVAQTEERLGIIDEKLDKLRAEVEDLQFRSKKMQEQLDDLQQQINFLRKAGGEVDVAGLEAKLKAIDAAREHDKQVILDTLAKELANISRPGGSATPAGGTDHVVQKGETLSAIASKYGVTPEAIVRANNLNNPNAIQIGQKLTIPK